MKKLIILSALIAVSQCSAADISQSESYAQGNNEVQYSGMTDMSTEIVYHEWSEEDKLRLVKHTNECKKNGKIDWNAVLEFFPGRTASNLSGYYWRYIGHNERYKKEAKPEAASSKNSPDPVKARTLEIQQDTNALINKAQTKKSEERQRASKKPYISLLAWSTTPAQTEFKRVDVQQTQSAHEVPEDFRNGATSKLPERERFLEKYNAFDDNQMPEAIVPSSTIAQSYMGKVPKRVYWTEEKKLRLVEYVKKHIVDKHVRWTNVYYYFPSKDTKSVESYFWQYVYQKNKELQVLLGRGTKGRKQGVVKPVVNVESLDDIVKQDQEAHVSKLMTEFICTQTLDE